MKLASGLTGGNMISCHLEASSAWRESFVCQLRNISSHATMKCWSLSLLGSYLSWRSNHCDSFKVYLLWTDWVLKSIFCKHRRQTLWIAVTMDNATSGSATSILSTESRCLLQSVHLVSRWLFFLGNWDALLVTDLCCFFPGLSLRFQCFFCIHYLTCCLCSIFIKSTSQLTAEKVHMLVCGCFRYDCAYAGTGICMMLHWIQFSSST